MKVIAWRSKTQKVSDLEMQRLTSVLTVAITIYMITFSQYNSVAASPISTPFRKNVLPLFFDFGKVVFWCTTVYGCYYLMRRQVNEGADRIKWAALGYIALRMINSFTDLVDAVADSMQF